MMAKEAGQNAAITARLDGCNNIIAADDLILRLQRAAGGEDNGRIAIPRIASVARLTRRLKIAVTRPLIIGGRDYDIRLWVRAYPLDNDVMLEFSEWQQLSHEDDEYASLRSAQVAMASGGMEWRTDRNMRYVQMPADPGFADIGDAFADGFLPDGEGITQVLAGVAERRPFCAAALLLKKNGQQVLASGHPVYDHDGSFLGYQGWLLTSGEGEDDNDDASLPSEPDINAALPDFGRRLDRALRQPLGRIIANAETIKAQKQGPLRTDYASYATDISHAGRHLLELVDDLADLQAIDRANFKVAKEDIDLADLGRRAAGLLGMKAADRQIKLVMPIASETAPAVGEFRRALQVIVNMLNNAIRYSPEHSSITISVARNDACAKITIADEGPGIAPEDQERVFEKFERLGRSDVIGSGLGLYISRRLARAMRGDIEIDSLPDQGARFTLWLPLTAA